MQYFICRHHHCWRVIFQMASDTLSCNSVVFCLYHGTRNIVTIPLKIHPLKVRPRTGHESPEGEEIYCSTLFLTLTVVGGGWSMPCPCHFAPWDRDPVPIRQEAGWAPGLVWMGAEISPPTGIRSPDCSAHCKWNLSPYIFYSYCMWRAEHFKIQCCRKYSARIYFACLVYWIQGPRLLVMDQQCTILLGDKLWCNVVSDAIVVTQ